MLRLNRTQEIFSSFRSICNKFSRSLVNQPNIMSENIAVDINQTEKRPHENEIETDVKKLKTDDPPVKRIKKRNFAMLLGYLGKNYYGMQRNPNKLTIEECLIKAMLKAELINQEAFETIQSINFQRAARTDKGVSAIRQVVSLKLPENPCKDKINENLPDDIRVFAIKRVTKGFNSKSQCDARTYSYTIPTYAFAPENLELYQKKDEFFDVEKRKEQLSIIDGKPFHEYRISKEDLQRLSETLKLYEGTHNFHNFTAKVLPLDPRAKRYIMSFVSEEPFLVDNMEFITVKIKGQSFMLHQIRKMMSMVVAVMRGIVTKETFNMTFEERRFDINIAPSLGLLLNIVHYDYYNKRYGGDGMHEKLDWAEHDEEIQEFAKNKIMKHIIDTEFTEKHTFEWLANLGYNSFCFHDERTNDKEDSKDDENDAE